MKYLQPETRNQVWATSYFLRKNSRLTFDLKILSKTNKTKMLFTSLQTDKNIILD